MLNKKHINKLTIALLALGVSQMACKTSYMPKKQNQAYLATNIGGGLEIQKNGTAGEPRKLAYVLNCDQTVMSFSTYSQENFDDAQSLSTLSSLSIYLIGPLGPAIFGSLAQQAYKRYHASLVDTVNANNSINKCVNAQ